MDLSTLTDEEYRVFKGQGIEALSDEAFAKLNPPPALPKEKSEKYKLGALREGALQGWGNEVTAGLVAGVETLKGGNFGEVYEDVRETEQYKLDQYRGDHGLEAYGLEAGAGLLSGIAAPYAAGKQLATHAPKAAGLLSANVPKWLTLPGVGALEGAGYGAGSSTPGKRGEGAQEGAVAGAIGGAVVKGGIELTKAAWKTILRPIWRGLTSTPKRDQARFIADALKREGIDPKLANEALKDMGDDAMVMDLGPFLQQSADSASMGTRPGKKIINEALDARALGQQPRLNNAAGEALGAYADDAKQFVGNIKTQMSEQAAPLYAKAHAANITGSPELRALWKRLPKEAFDAAKRIAKAEGVALDDMANVKLIDYVKQGVDEVIASRWKGSSPIGKKEARLLIEARNEILDIVDDQVPDYKKARGIWAGGSNMVDAVDLGRDIFKQDFDEVADVVKRLGESERQAYRYGVSRAVQDKVESAGETHDAAKRLLRNTTTKKILRAAFDDDEAFEAFMKQVGHEATYTGTKRVVQGNSNTVDRMLGEERIEIPTSAAEGVGWFKRELGRNPLDDPETNKLISEALTQKYQVPAVRGRWGRRKPPTGLLGLPETPQSGVGLLEPPRR